MTSKIEELDQFSDEDVDDKDLNSIFDKMENETNLSEGQKSRMEKNKLKALALKKARLMSNPYDKNKPNKKTQSTKLIDSGGGFFIEEKEEAPAEVIEILEQPPPVLPLTSRHVRSVTGTSPSPTSSTPSVTASVTTARTWRGRDRTSSSPKLMPRSSF